MANFNAPGTKFNTDEKFAKISLDETVKMKWEEAVAVDNGEDSILIHGFVQSCTNLKNFDNDKWVFEPCLATVEVRKKTLEGTNKAGKPYKFEALPMGLAMIDAVVALGFNVPFHGLLDMTAGSDVALWLKGLPNADGEVAEEAELAFIKKKMLSIAPLEKLVKLEGVTLPAGKSSKGGYGGSGGQKESAKIADRLTWLKTLEAGSDESLEALFKVAYGENFPTNRGLLIAQYLEQLFN